MPLLWPARSEYVNETPLFVGFSNHFFSSSLGIRSRSIGTFWHSLNTVFLPAPNALGTTINMDYTTNTARISADRNFNVDMKGMLPIHQGTLVHTTSGYDLNRRGAGYENSINNSNETIRYGEAGENGGGNYVDSIDTTWLGQSRRGYKFRFILICKSIEDSIIGAEISNFFSNALLSSMEHQSRSAVIFNARSFHPPMWAIFATDRRSGIAESTKRWIGTYPQLCVLKEATAMRVGGDGNTILGMAHSLASGLYPISYDIRLTFIELEPVYSANNNSTESKSRSQFFVNK